MGRNQGDGHEMKQVLLLGLYFQAVDIEEIKEQQANGVEVWTMNDFYMFYPFFRPDRIFQIHDPSRLRPNENFRWAGDYKECYNVCDCPVMQLYEDSGVENVEIMDMFQLMKHAPVELFQSTTNYMIAYAAQLGFADVYFAGMDFVNDEERRVQVPFLVRMIEHLKSKIQFHVDPDLWKSWKEKGAKVKWENVVDMSPYHVRESSLPIGIFVTEEQKYT